MRTGPTVAVALAVLLLSACDPASTQSDPQPTPATTWSEVAPTTAPPTTAGAASPTTAPPTTAGAASPTATQLPVIKKQTVTETQALPFTTRTVNDPSLAKGTTRVKTQGVAGVRTRIYEVTFTNGVQTGRKLLRTVVTRAPVTKVVAVGTKSERQCDPNYSGACVPIASDVDCAGGSGDGPAYVSGPVKVIGSDIYGLDRDGDGYGCE